MCCIKMVVSCTMRSEANEQWARVMGTEKHVILGDGACEEASKYCESLRHFLSNHVREKMKNVMIYQIDVFEDARTMVLHGTTSCTVIPRARTMRGRRTRQTEVCEWRVNNIIPNFKRF